LFPTQATSTRNKLLEMGDNPTGPPTDNGVYEPVAGAGDNLTCRVRGYGVTWRTMNGLNKTLVISISED
jgi:hypothetical protein